jgi:hypothetical protein
MPTTQQVTGYKIDAAKPEGAYLPCDPRELVAQIGKMNVWAISGGRVIVASEGILMPVAQGHWVTVHLMADDTYPVRHAYHRAGKTTWKQEWEDVYADMVGDVAYEASLWQN